MDNSVNVRAIETLNDLRAALIRFAGRVGEALHTADTEIRRTQEWLRERELHWQREVERAREAVRQAQAALRHCQSQVYRDRDGRTYHPPCDAEKAALARAEAHLRQVEAELQRVRMWKARVEQAVGEYRLHERRLWALTTLEAEHAKAFLERARGDLERYRAIGLLAGVAGILGGVVGGVATAVWGRGGSQTVSGSHPLPVPRPLPVTSGGEALAGLQSDNWQGLSLSERGQVLQELENTMAQAQGRLGVPVEIADLPPGEMGGYDRDSKTVTVSREHVTSRNVREVADTIVHEGRHAYQHHAIEHPGFHSDTDQVEVWRDNFVNYVQPQDNPKRYWKQPIEREARQYAADVITSLFGGKT